MTDALSSRAREQFSQPREQALGEDEGGNGGCLGPQCAVAQSEHLEASSGNLDGLVRGEAALGTNKDAGAARSIELSLPPATVRVRHELDAVLTTQESSERFRMIDDRRPAAAALRHCRLTDPSPAVEPCEMSPTLNARGQYRNDCRSAALGGLLNRPVERLRVQDAEAQNKWRRWLATFAHERRHIDLAGLAAPGNQRCHSDSARQVQELERVADTNSRDTGMPSHRLVEAQAPERRPPTGKNQPGQFRAGEHTSPTHSLSCLLALTVRRWRVSSWVKPTS